MKDKNISVAVIRRLPKYHRYLKEMLDNDIKRISSKELSKMIGFTASQIRQDLNNFGGFGQQGYGYNVEDLYNEIGKILGLTRQYNVVIVGAGNLGQALANYSSFDRLGFKLQAMFDVNPKVIGLKINNVEVMDMDKFEQFVDENNVEIVYICTSRDGAQEVADKIQKTKVRAIWNFAPVDLKLKSDIIVENIHLIDNLLTVSYFLKENLE
ncbi:redox-sensing transcriptional repressor Rex [Fusibacter bizertensis]|jgi:AT-rich DNA-binding protein|uniref:Redox-sensing transcriptional repressor Rex n=1 Tax=Fusibacter bizertensis TaxID=1488331 RepID=A0ABT6NDW8_9FIRM|nr:redox-sensing transcriptional repressor Rex [Fusibacter bizertensis]MDH8678624.1 redox-sensing transcriptional repressor Rex [Fusibacter bizertensis]